MAYTMLGTYKFENLLNDNFNILFQIPDNCNYQITLLNGEYTIKVNLNSGQLQPSTNFIQYSEPAKATNKILVAKFEQYEKSGTVVRKPKGTIEI